MILEVIATCADDVETAVACGADRIELVTGIAEGGLTPSLALIEAAVILAGEVPVQVMIRPHSKSFCYNENDIAVMLRDIDLVKQAGAKGIVIGALTAGGTIDLRAVERLLQAAERLDITFHRAFDKLEDQNAAYKQLGRYPQISRILTSGGGAHAAENVSRIRSLNAYKTGPAIMAGYGLTPDNLSYVLRETAVREVHFGSGVRLNRSYIEGIDSQAMAELRKIIQRHSDLL